MYQIIIFAEKPYILKTKTGFTLLLSDKTF